MNSNKIQLDLIIYVHSELINILIFRIFQNDSNERLHKS